MAPCIEQHHCHCKPLQAYVKGKDINDDMALEGHAVFVVGYNDTGAYWLVKNSWGTELPTKATPSNSKHCR